MQPVLPTVRLPMGEGCRRAAVYRMPVHRAAGGAGQPRGEMMGRKADAGASYGGRAPSAQRSFTSRVSRGLDSAGYAWPWGGAREPAAREAVTHRADAAHCVDLREDADEAGRHELGTAHVSEEHEDAQYDACQQGHNACAAVRGDHCARDLQQAEDGAGQQGREAACGRTGAAALPATAAATDGRRRRGHSLYTVVHIAHAAANEQEDAERVAEEVRRHAGCLVRAAAGRRRRCRGVRAGVRAPRRARDRRVSGPRHRVLARRGGPAKAGLPQQVPAQLLRWQSEHGALPRGPSSWAPRPAGYPGRGAGRYACPEPRGRMPCSGRADRIP